MSLLIRDFIYAIQMEPLDKAICRDQQLEWELHKPKIYAFIRYVCWLNVLGDVARRSCLSYSSLCKKGKGREGGGGGHGNVHLFLLSLSIVIYCVNRCLPDLIHPCPKAMITHTPMKMYNIPSEWPLTSIQMYNIPSEWPPQDLTDLAPPLYVTDLAKM